MLKTILLISLLFDVDGGIPGFHPSMLTVKQIPLPEGYERVALRENSFALFLRNLPLRKDNTVYLYNGQRKPNQLIHYAVIDISTGSKDLQQCADAIMRLRAEYFYAKQQYDSICFLRNGREFYRFTVFAREHGKPNRDGFMRFMETVFMNCGTYSLQQQLKPVIKQLLMQVGDVWIKGGAPGHAAMVVDMAVNKQTGKKIFLLAEGYMPAQDIHIVSNPRKPLIDPWYELTEEQTLITPTWLFYNGQLRRW